MCLNSGDIIGGRYRIDRLLGRGGFAITYLATDTQLPNGGRQCVVKEITPRSKDPSVLQDARERFDREARALNSLGCEHRQIPELYAYFEENEKFYLVQEYIEGDPLSQELTPGRQLNEEEVIDLLQDILGILTFVHNYSVIHNGVTYDGIIHRDIKPPNLIRRNQDRRIVLIDFGAVKEISKLAVNSLGQVTLTDAIGTSGYMAPEQSNCRPELNSDIYAVGMIGIQAITGLKPSVLARNRDKIVWRSSRPGQPMVQVSDGLAKVLDKMVRYDSRKRYQSASKVLEDLAKLQRGENFWSDLQSFFLGIFPRSLSSRRMICLFIIAGILTVVFTSVYFHLPLLVILTSGAKSWKSIVGLLLIFVGFVFTLNGIYQAIF